MKRSIDASDHGGEEGKNSSGSEPPQKKATPRVEEVNEELKGNEDLVSGFNNLMQKESEVKFPCVLNLQEKPPAEFTEVLNFVRKVRTHFEGNEHKDHKDGVLMSLLGILRLHKQNLKSFTDTYHEIVSLLKDHKDLLDEFNDFFPPNLFPELSTTPLP